MCRCPDYCWDRSRHAYLMKLGHPGDLLRGYWQFWAVCDHESCKFSLRINGKRKWSCWITWFVAPNKHLRFHTWHRCVTFFLPNFLLIWVVKSEQVNRWQLFSLPLALDFVPQLLNLPQMINELSISKILTKIGNFSVWCAKNYVAAWMWSLTWRSYWGFQEKMLVMSSKNNQITSLDVAHPHKL